MGKTRKKQGGFLDNIKFIRFSGKKTAHSKEQRETNEAVEHGLSRS